MEFKWSCDKLPPKLHKAAMDGAYLGAEAVLTKAINQAPLESGTMERSGAVTETKETVHISFNTPYARKQHEDLTLNHANGRKAKYLEDPFNEDKDKIIKLMNLKVQEALGR